MKDITGEIESITKKLSQIVENGDVSADFDTVVALEALLDKITKTNGI